MLNIKRLNRTSQFSTNLLVYILVGFEIINNFFNKLNQILEIIINHQIQLAGGSGIAGEAGGAQSDCGGQRILTHVQSCQYILSYTW